ncbi:MAG: polysaccharide deacetylase family protein [Anaerolineaceae bacterium]|jgi:peptidoglycan/xylan/chitin deacetylase (PgdA/CDA1 family)
MRIPGKKTAIQVKRWLSSRSSPRAMILGYHRVATLDNDVYDICVAPDRFAEQMEALRQYYRLVSLAELVAGLVAGTLRHKSVAVTFDDGYADNLYTAKPILERFDIPATVFVSTGNPGQEFWWHQLERVIFAPPTIAEAITMPVGDALFHWEGSDRKNLLEKLYDRLIPETPEIRYRVISAIQELTGHPSTARPNRLALSSSEIIDLAKGGLVDVGAHSHTHPILSLLALDQQRAEINASKTTLEEMLGWPVAGFAYPNGIYHAVTQAIVQEAGFAYACSSHRNVVWGRQDCYQLPRFWPKNWDGDRLMRDLRLWLG